MRHRSLSLLVFVLVSGCSNKEPELTADDFKAQYPEAYCAHLFRCCDGDERSYGSTVVCQEQVRSAVQELLGFSALATPFAQFSATSAKGCLERLRQQSCADLSLIEPGCAEGTVTPLHKEGEECTYSSECQTFYCIQPQKLVRGACGAAGGPPCSGDDRACRAAHFCQGTQCQPKKGNADLCGAGKECESGICAPTTKTCVPRPNPYCDGK